MSLKDLTKDSHTAAEQTKFMQAVFKKKMPLDVWADFTHQKTLIYNAIEGCAGASDLLTGIEDIRRAYLLYQDYLIMTEGKEKITAHLYTWHLGDLHGGQMIKKILPGSHKNLEFKNSEELIKNVRLLLDDSMADEANLAFKWAMKIMEEYDDLIDL